MAADPHPPPQLAIGVAGWDYPDWQDTVYRLPAPPALPDLFGRVAEAPPQYPPDRLAFLTRYVDMVEVNSSFYRTPSPATVRAWADRVAPATGFFFTAKLSQDFTHRFLRDEQLAAACRRAFAPLQERQLLRGLLAQFRYDFADTPAGRDLVRWLHGAFAGFAPLIVEVRHRSWEESQALAFLADLGLSVANLDYPTAHDSFNPGCCVTAPHAYLRLHGRNREAWFAKHESPHEPYNYDYPDGEIDEIAVRAQSILREARSLTIVANNHYRGKAASAAARLKAVLTGRRVPVPPALLATYPGLQRIATSD